MTVRVRAIGEGSKLINRGNPIIFKRWLSIKKLPIGEMVEVIADDAVACGLTDKIGVKILAFENCPNNIQDLFMEVIEKAFTVKFKLGWQAYRLINGDGDSFPGLIVDVYKDIAVLQSSSLAIDRHIMTIAKIVKEVTGVDTVAEKSVQRVRAKVGLKPREGILIGKKKETVVDEEGVKFKVSLEGQKTGLYLDQRENRIFMEKFAEGKFLDAFSYTGGFGLHALRAGARKVTFVDEDPWALKVLRDNLKLNGIDEEKVEVVRSDAWKFMERALRKGSSFGSGSVDPPALMDDRPNGFSLYIKAYSLAFKITEGVLALSSCSRSMDRETFLRALSIALSPSYRILEIRGSAADHSIRFGLEDYLKTAFVSE